MSIWRLEPIDTTDNNWRASAHVGPVLIRAADEQRARAIATGAFFVAAEHVAGLEVPVNPWEYNVVVSCLPANETTFAEEGPDEILDPPGYDDEWHRKGV